MASCALNFLEAVSVKNVVNQYKQKNIIASIYDGETYFLGNKDIDEINGIENLKEAGSAKTLILTGNKLVQLSGKKLLKWQSLENLFVNHNNLFELDVLILLLPKLKQLDVSYNHLAKLSDLFNNNAICAIESLNLANNNITELPDSLLTSNSLHRLNIANNQMVELPDALSAMKSLKKLILFDGNAGAHSNNIETLPDGFKKLAKTLKELWIDASKLDGKSKEMLSQMQDENGDLIICKNAKEVIARQEELHKTKRVGTRDFAGARACC